MRLDIAAVVATVGQREVIATLWHRAVEPGEANPDIEAETGTNPIHKTMTRLGSS